jgi:dUTP pyrophosphatase
LIYKEIENHYDEYANDDNDGEIAGQFMNFTDQPVAINKGDRIMQGVFSPFFTVSDDNAQGTRNGGFGSTDK